MPIRVTVWNEYRHEKTDENVRAVYPDGIHAAIAAFLGEQTDFTLRTATLDEPEHGLTQAVLADTDVLIWWGHMAHEAVSDEIVNRVFDRITNHGLGLIVLHSGHGSKLFGKLCGTPANKLSWREDLKLERLWVVDPSHPIAAGIKDYFEIPQTEMYGEYFNIPQPDELVFISWFEGGEVFRSGFILRRGRGKVFYFRPGHESLPIYKQAEVQRVIINGIRYVCAPSDAAQITYRDNIPLKGKESQRQQNGQGRC